MTYEDAIQDIPCGRYRHFRGGDYVVMHIARHCETSEPMVVYHALDRGSGVWVRPAETWNETIVEDGKAYRRFYPLDRIERVERYERLFDEARVQPTIDKLRALEAYFTSGLWLEDYTADENGELPPDLKRGVLSQDALYNFLEDVER